MGEKENTYRLLVRKPDGEKLLRTRSHRWVDNKTDLRKREDWVV
jgi:hypothetical protein